MADRFSDVACSAPFVLGFLFQGFGFRFGVLGFGFQILSYARYLLGNGLVLLVERPGCKRAARDFLGYAFLHFGRAFVQFVKGKFKDAFKDRFFKGVGYYVLAGGLAVCYESVDTVAPCFNRLGLGFLHRIGKPVYRVPGLSGFLAGHSLCHDLRDGGAFLGHLVRVVHGGEGVGVRLVSEFEYPGIFGSVVDLVGRPVRSLHLLLRQSFDPFDRVSYLRFHESPQYNASIALVRTIYY